MSFFKETGPDILLEDSLNKKVESKGDNVDEGSYKESFLNLIKENFSNEDFSEIRKALLIADEIHEDQIQPDGQPYIKHPLEVASVIIEKFKLKEADLVISALLHDVMEDQSERLFANYLEKNDFFSNSVFNILNLKSFVNKFSDEIREIAYLEIKENFNSLIAERVRRLSKPDFEELIDSLNIDITIENKQRIKNKMYKEYFSNLLGHDDQGLGVIKCADLLNNISKNHLLVDGVKKKKLIEKYSPVIIDVVIPFLRGIEPEHCLYDNSQLVLKSFLEIYNRDFAIS